MKSIILIWLVVIGAACVSCVVLETKLYSCCRGQHPVLDFDPKCEHSFSIDDEPFANFDINNSSFKLPCMTLRTGRITLDSCMNFTDTVTHQDDQCSPVERRITFVPECTATPAPIKITFVPECTATPAPIKIEQRARYGLLASSIFLLIMGIIVIIGIVVHCVRPTQNTQVAGEVV